MSGVALKNARQTVVNNDQLGGATQALFLTQVPEPSGIVLAIVGLLKTASNLRRRRNKKSSLLRSRPNWITRSATFPLQLEELEPRQLLAGLTVSLPSVTAAQSEQAAIANFRTTELLPAASLIPVFDANDRTATATPIAVGGSIVAQIDSPTDVDLYAFTIGGGHRIGFDIDTTLFAGLDSFIRLFHATGNVYDHNDDGLNQGPLPEGRIADSYLYYTLPNPGTYYLGVSTAGNSAYNPITGGDDVEGWSQGSYTLTLHDFGSTDPDDQLSDVLDDPPLSLGVSARSYLWADGDVNLYRFSVAAGQTLGFDIDSDPDRFGNVVDTRLRLFNAAGLQLGTNDDALNSGPLSETSGLDPYLVHAFSTGGTYFLGVSYFGNSNYDPITGLFDTPHVGEGAYELTMQLLPSGDSNGNGQVDGADYTAWADHYLRAVTPGDARRGDFNGDGLVDGVDYTVWADNFLLAVSPIESRQGVFQSVRVMKSDDGVRGGDDSALTLPAVNVSARDRQDTMDSGLRGARDVLPSEFSATGTVSTVEESRRHGVLGKPRVLADWVDNYSSYLAYARRSDESGHKLEDVGDDQLQNRWINLLPVFVTKRR